MDNGIIRWNSRNRLRTYIHRRRTLDGRGFSVLQGKKIPRPSSTPAYEYGA